TASGSLTFDYLLDAQTTITLGGNASKTDTDPYITRTSSSGYQAGLIWEASERLRFNLSYGRSRVLIRSAPATGCPVPQIFCDAGLVPVTVIPEQEQTVRPRTYNLNAVWQLDSVSSVSVNAMRSISASGTGVPVQTDTVGAALSRRLGERLDLSLQASYIDGDSLAGLVEARTRTRTFSALLTH